MGNITGALIENAFQPQQNDDLSDSPPLNVEEEIKRIARDSSNRELYRLLHAKMEQTALDRAAAATHAPSMNSEGGCGDGGGPGKKWESSGRRPSSEEQSSVRCGSAGGRGGPQCVVENAPLSSECGTSADGKSGGLTMTGSKPESDGGREPPRMGFFKKNLLKSYWTENEDTSSGAAKTDPPAAAVPDGEKDAGKKLDVEANAKDGAANLVADRRSLSTDLKLELLGDNDAARPRTKLMNINTCIEVIVMNELKKLDSVPDDLPGPRQMPLFATLESSRTRSGENRGNDLARVNAGGNRGAVEPGWPLRNESGSRAADTEPKREKWPQYVNLDPVPERAPSEFSPQQQLMARKTDVGVAGGGSRNVPSSAYRSGGYPPEAMNMNQESVPRIYTSSSGDSTARNVRLTNQFGESGVDVVPTSHGGAPVVKYSPSSAWSRDISPAQSSPHVMMSGDSSGFKVMPSSAAAQLPSMPMLDQRRKPERESEPAKYQQQAEYLSYVGQQQYHGVSNLPEQHSAAAYQNCPPVLQEKLHASSDLGHYGYPSKNQRERVHAQQFDSSSFGNHPDNLQPPVANYIKHSPKNSPILAYERDGTARPLGPPEPQYHHRPDQPQYHPRNDQAQYHHRSDQAAQYHRSDQLLKSQPGSLMSGSARSYRMVGDQPLPPQQQQVQAPQPPPVPQVYYRSERQTRGELVPMVDKKGFPAYQSVPPEEYVERRMKRPSASSSSSSSTTRGEMGNVSVGLDHHQQQQQQQQPILRSLSISYPPRGGGGRGGGGGEVTEKGHWGHSSEETPLDLTVKKEFPDAHHHHPSASSYHLPPGMKQQQQQQQADWGAVARGGYRQSYAGEEDPLGARLMNRATAAPQKLTDFPMPEMQRRDMLDVRSSVYDKVPSGLQQQAQHPPPESSEMGRMVPAAPASINERSMAMRTSVIASHPFDDSPSGLAPPPLHLTMQQLSEALTKTSTHQMGAWKQSPYGGGEMVPRSRAHTLESEPSSRLTIDASSRQERPRPRPNNSTGNDLLHLATTSPTIPHLSPVQPLVSTAASSQQAPGSRRAMGPSLLGSHSPSDILHLQCKVCGSTYGSLRSFRMHFAKVHGLEPLPEHCNISTISGTKNAMSGKAAMEDSEPPALQRETMPTDVASIGKNRGGFESFGNAAARPTKPDVLRVEPAPANIRTKQVAEVYPMPARTTSRGLSPQLKAEGSASGWRAELTELHAEQNEGQMKVGGDVKNSGRLVNCDLGIFRSRNCYSDLGCDRDTDCPECLDGFKDISDWKMHISTHMMRSCTCKACNLSFTHSGALKKHLHAVHSHVDKVEVEYRCLFCREAFSDEKVLFYHTQEHEKRYSRLDSSRRDSISSSSLSFKAAGGGSGGADPDCIQMAVPDTTCSDDARPTSEFGGESSSNVSPSSFPGVDSKGGGSTTTESKVDPSALCPATLDSGRTDDDRKVKTGELELGYKQRAMLRGLDSSSDHSRGSEHARLDVVAASQLLYRSHAVQHAHKSDDREMTVESKLDAKFSFDIGEECRHFKPTVTPPRAVVEETSTFVWKKQAVLKRVQSGESRDAIDADPNAPPTDKLSPVSSRSASMSRGGGGSGTAEKSPSEVSQPMHLRDLFSMMGQQVEKSIWGIPDFPQFNSAPAARGSRCVRDVCDEIIALSFREESSPRDPPVPPPGSMSDKSDTIAKSNVCEQLKTLVNPDHDTRPELVLPEVRPNPEGLYGGAWTRSPCSSRDSCHSLEIDESRFNQDSAEGESNRLESTDSEPPRSLYGDPVVESTSPRRDYGRKESTETPEDGKHPVDGDAKVAFGGRGHRGRDDEGGMVVRHSDAFFSRRPSSEGPQPPVDTATTMSRTKDVRSPSSLSKQEASADGDDGKSSDSNPVVGSKRKHHASDGAKEAGDTVVDEPPTKKSAPS